MPRADVGMATDLPETELARDLCVSETVFDCPTPVVMIMDLSATELARGLCVGETQVVGAFGATGGTSLCDVGLLCTCL